MTADYFEKQIERLRPLGAVSDQFKDGYWDALKDIPADVFDAAVSHALKTRSWFPKPAELRIDADAVWRTVRPVPAEEDRGTDLPAPVSVGVLPDGTPIPVQHRVWKYYCDDCEDQGWASFWCGEIGPARKPWQMLMPCDRTKPHMPHEWVKHCHCYETNPALVRKREAFKKYAEAPRRNVA